MLFYIGGFLSSCFAFRSQYKHANSTVATSEQSDHDRPDDQTQDQPLYEVITGVEPQSLKLHVEENAGYQEELLDYNVILYIIYSSNLLVACV